LGVFGGEGVESGRWCGGANARGRGSRFGIAQNGGGPGIKTSLNFYKDHQTEQPKDDNPSGSARGPVPVPNRTEDKLTRHPFILVQDLFQDMFHFIAYIIHRYKTTTTAQYPKSALSLIDARDNLQWKKSVAMATASSLAIGGLTVVVVPFPGMMPGPGEKGEEVGVRSVGVVVPTMVALGAQWWVIG